MIATLTGRLTRKAPDYLIVDVSGVGYQVSVPLSTYYQVSESGGEVSLYIHTHVREDSLSLFGFLTEAEKEMFLLLMGVSGIGPKLALAVLSTLSVQELSHAIQSSDDSRLCSIPGIGKKTAARMVLELKDKITRAAPGLSPAALPVPSTDVEDAVSALVNLGYKKQLAEEALKKVQRGGACQTVEELIREALHVLMKR
jgi:Holliday junction DNA helicase RuvA